MEHLFFNPSQDDLDRETQQILIADVLHCDWSQASEIGRGPELFRYPWLGFDHDTRTSGSSKFDTYAVDRGWHLSASQFGSGLQLTEMLEGDATDDLRLLFPDHAAHVKNPTEYFVSLLQSWALFGLLEAVTEIPIAVDYLVRYDHAVSPVIDTRNLTYLLHALNTKLSRLTDVDLASQLERIIRELRAWTELVIAMADYCMAQFEPIVPATESLGASEVIARSVMEILLLTVKCGEITIFSLNATFHSWLRKNEVVLPFVLMPRRFIPEQLLESKLTYLHLLHQPIYTALGAPWERVMVRNLRQAHNGLKIHPD